jgi:hypothetical protein
MYDLVRAFFALFQYVDDAEKRGTRLLHANLTAIQLRELKDRAYFEVIGGASGSRYRIHDCATVNIDQLDADKKVVQKWCFAPEGNLASGDVLLAQKLALELFEDEALSIARRHPAHH